MVWSSTVLIILQVLVKPLYFKAIQGNIFLHAPVAQGIEQRTSNPLVVGSIPTRRTSKINASGVLNFGSFCLVCGFGVRVRGLGK